jgi:hypothetical protein
MDPMAPAGTPASHKNTTVVTSTSGAKFEVASEFAENFKGFIDEYEKRGGVIGPAHGGVGERPGNASYHPLGRAIDVNQIGYGIRGGGKTLPVVEENELAKSWGLYPGDLFHNRKDTGHFEVRDAELAREAIRRRKAAAEAKPAPAAPSAEVVKPAVAKVTATVTKAAAESVKAVADAFVPDPSHGVPDRDKELVEGGKSYPPGVLSPSELKKWHEYSEKEKAAQGGKQSDAGRTLATTVAKIAATAKTHADGFRVAAARAVTHAATMHVSTPLGAHSTRTVRVDARHEQHIYVHGNDSPTATATAVQTAQNSANSRFVSDLTRKVA